MNKELTTGNPYKLIFKFTIPILLGNLLQQFFGILGAVILGRFKGLNSLAAVGSTAPINWLIVGSVTSIAAGFGIPVANLFGADNMSGVRRCIMNILYLTVTISVIFTVLSMTLAHEILTVMQTPPDLFSDAYSYLLAYFSGMGFIMLFNVLSGISRAVGDSRTPVYFVTILAFFNVLLQVLFIGLLNMGALGVGISSVTAYFITSVLFFIRMYRHFPQLLPTKVDLAIDRGLIKRLLTIGFPMAVHNSFTSVGHIIMQATINHFGTVAVSIVTSATKVENLLITVYFALGVTMSVYSGQNLGAKRLDRVRQGAKVAFVYILIISAITMLLAVFAGTQFSRLFVVTDDLAVLEGIHSYLVVVGMFFLPFGVMIALRNTIQGLGYSSYAMISGVFELVPQIVIAFIALRWIGFDAVIYAHSAAWLFACLFIVPMYFKVMKMLQKSHKEVNV